MSGRTSPTPNLIEAYIPIKQIWVKPCVACVLHHKNLDVKPLLLLSTRSEDSGFVASALKHLEAGCAPVKGPPGW